MRIRSMSVTALILLGIIIFSFLVGFDDGVFSKDKEAIQRIENHNNLSEASKELDSLKEEAGKANNISKSSDNENLTKNLLKTAQASIFREIRPDNISIEPPESCDEFKIVIVNSSNFMELAANGTLSLNIMEEDYELKLQERETCKPNITSYSGYIIDKPQSSAFFTIKNNSIDGCINVDFYTLSYGIASTKETYEGEIVHILCRYYNEAGEEELKKHYSLDPLEFSLKNSDKKSHEISIELFDFYNTSIFKENYSMNSGDVIFSPKINVEPAYYRYEIILDNKFIFEQKVQADYAAELGSSEKIYLNIQDNPDNPIEFGMEIA